MSVAGKQILVGISGGIAAYKSPLLVRQLAQAGAHVRVVMTENAHAFVTATTLTALCGEPPRSATFDLEAEAAMGHIELARWADALVVAPATANTIAKLAHGIADDLLGTLALASTAPLFLAPAMNQQMWAHPSVAANLATLADRGATIIGPASGEQACGDIGAGRMSEPEEIAAALAGVFATGATVGSLTGRHVVITAGPTREAIDPVRFISNHSSGKQGYAIAAAARAAGARVTLISGPTALAAPAGCERINVESAQQMLAASQAQLGSCDVFIGVAAVADYRPSSTADQKIKREGTDSLSVAMTMNPDIIRSVAEAAERPPLVVGFAAETQRALEHARAKRLRKGLDLIVVNDVSRGDIGFNSDDNAATIIGDFGETAVSKCSKNELARELITTISALLNGQLAPTNPESAAQ